MKTPSKNLALGTTPCLFLAGCGHAPAINILGSFFPAWMICLTVGVVLAFVVRFILLRYRLETDVGPLALFYPCIVILSTCSLWLIFFR